MLFKSKTYKNMLQKLVCNPQYGSLTILMQHWGNGL
ncbi:hypothetical protein CUMW_140440 [Citrus unshiu]|uniref:Uncharacterized protein n=1 Tax=Citrus unshiu TaxID=55188 RepID=A0A2H5PIQ1_CITUN|nr:hypothetical protein CUMW_140440 [Citrus unshiu]